MSFTKLDENITESSVWAEDDKTLRCWIYLLAKSNAYGIIEVTVPVIAIHCMTTVEKVHEILAKFSSPDPQSRDQQHEGRRIAISREPEWHIILLNHEKYKRKDHGAAIRQKRYRDKVNALRDVTRDVTLGDVTTDGGDVTLRDPSHISDVIYKTEETTSTKDSCPSGDVTLRDHSSTKPARKRASMVYSDQDFALFWKDYPRKVAKGRAWKAWKNIKDPRPTIGRLLGVLASQKKSADWIKERGKYIPHPATYLNDRRWEDEVGQPPPGGRDYMKLIEERDGGDDA